MGYEFTEQALYRTSELADMPLWVIHAAWPVAGASWMLFLGVMMADDVAILRGEPA